MPVEHLSYGSSESIIHSPVNAASAIYGFATETRKLLDEAYPKTLIIGTHPTMKDAIGKRMLRSSEFSESEMEEVIGSSADVRDRLEAMIHSHYRQYAIVIAAYESHHFDPVDRDEILNLMEMLSHGTVIVTDFALAMASEEEAFEMAHRKIDKGQLSLFGGERPSLSSDRVYTPGSFFDQMNEPAWHSASKFELDDFGVGFVGSSMFNTHEMSEITMSALSVRNHTLEILADRYRRIR